MRICRTSVLPNVEPCYIDYGGPWPSSERETQAVTSFIMQRKESIEAFVTVHNFGQMILSRWAYTDKLYLPEHNETVCHFICLFIHQRQRVQATYASACLQLKYVVIYLPLCVLVY